MLTVVADVKKNGATQVSYNMSIPQDPSKTSIANNVQGTKKDFGLQRVMNFEAGDTLKVDFTFTETSPFVGNIEVEILIHRIILKN